MTDRHFPRYARRHYQLLRDLGYTRKYARSVAILDRFLGKCCDEGVAW